MINIALMRLFLTLVFIAFNLNAMKTGDVPDEYYFDQRNDCRDTIIESVEAYLLVLPTELGCLPCRYFHTYLKSGLYTHVNKRKAQLETLKNTLTKSAFCAPDVVRYLDQEMAEFAGELGNKFYESNKRKLANFIKYFHKYLERKNTKCSLCNKYAANIIFSCGHMTTCNICETDRLYHHCLLCDFKADSETEDVKISFDNTVLLENNCYVCFEKKMPIQISLSCGHANPCAECASKANQCMLCRKNKTHVLYLDRADYQEICMKCKMHNSDALFLTCNHVSTCINCARDSNNLCMMCEKISSDGVLQLYF